MRYFKIVNAILILAFIQLVFIAILYNKKLQDLKDENGMEHLSSFYIRKNSNFKLKNSKLINLNHKNFLVILIQVHDRFENLKILVESLRFTKYINSTIIIFSHDLIDPQIDQFIEKIDFAAVTQF